MNEDSRTVRTLYAADYLLYSNVWRNRLVFHLRTYCEMRRHQTGQEVKVIHSGVNRPLFASASERTRFERWYAKYRKLFKDGEGQSAFLPSLWSGEFPALTGIDAPFSFEKDTGNVGGSLEVLGLAGSTPKDQYIEEILVAWSWIMANAKGLVWRSFRGWLFSRPGDAAVYRLTHGSKEVAAQEAA